MMLATNALKNSLNGLKMAVLALQTLCDRRVDEATWLAESRHILHKLLLSGDELPASHQASHPQYYQQHPLHIDPAGRFSLSSFVWGPGQGTPIHDHGVAGWVGVLTGAECCQRYSEDGVHALGQEHRLNPGDMAAVTPHDASVGDVHTVRNAYADRTSISIHLYRGDIAALPRRVFKEGVVKPFQSSYSGAAALV
jgi:3-mercaptopropionate dioxygenase